MATHVYTSVVSNYIPKARVLANSIKRFHPDIVFHLMLADDPPAQFQLKNEPFDSLITIANLGLENSVEWLFIHSLVEASTGVKGFALKAILQQPTCSEVFYFDPDIVVLAPLDDLIVAFGDGAVLLTPHLTEPETTNGAILDNEFSVLRHGIYNLGFVGVKNNAEGRQFAEWWCDRLRDFCFDDIPRGLFTDQRWADLAPAYFRGCVILRDPVYNVATWNLTGRRVEGTLDRLMVGGRRVVFYHFSGLDSGAQEAMLNKYGADMPVLYALREWYIAESNRMGQEEFGRIRWRYGYFDNGEPVTPQHRRLYRDRDDIRHAFPNPYLTSDVAHSYYHWYNAESAASARLRCTPTSQSDREYRIVLSVTTEDGETAAETARCLLRNSRGSSEMFLAGTASARQAVLADPTLAAAYRALDVSAASTHAANFGVALSLLADRDFIFVQAGIEAPEYWDLRLAWTAWRQVGVATVSPMCDTLPILGVGVPLNQRFSTACLDQRSYRASHHELIELPAFLEECVYVSAEAANMARLRVPSHHPAPSDFATFLAITQSLRYSHLLADHVFVGRTGELGANRLVMDGNSTNHRLAEVRRRIHSAQISDKTIPVIAAVRPRQLHIMHSWGGGLERWVREYCRADQTHANFVLKSVGTWKSFGMELRLHRDCDDSQPIGVWPLTPAIKSTATEHEAYRSALAEIVERFGVGRILISSLIGHSLDALDTKIPTLVVCHDFYPFCPALNITFGKVCAECDGRRLTECTRENPHNRFFLNVPPPSWIELRRSFVEKIQRSGVPMIAPSPSVRDQYVKLAPELGSAFRVITHGTRSVGVPPLKLSFSSDRPLRILVLGSIAPNKGLELLETAAPQLLEFSRLFLIGCGDYGKSFETLPGVTIVPKYRWDDLPAILRELEPDIALLPSSVPETFSYTLQELNELAIPTLATDIGSYSDRIQDGIDGFLCAPAAGAILARLREFASNRSLLPPVHQRLKAKRSRPVSEMIDEYEALLPAPQAPSRAYFCPDSRLGASATRYSRAQLFWRASDETYSEKQSASIPFELKPSRQILRFTIPSGQLVPAELRYDPAEQSGGLLLLHVMRLFDAQGTKVCEWREDQSAIDALTRSEITVLGKPSGNRGILMLVGNTDPHLILPVPCQGKDFERGGILEAEFTWPYSSADLPAKITSLTAGEPLTLCAEECDELVGRGGGIQVDETGSFDPRESFDAVRQSLAAARMRVADMESSLSWRVAAPLRVVGGLVLNLKGRRSVRSKGEAKE
jgi:glycosyltransferase involved in cell wall biosynthesis